MSIRKYVCNALQTWKDETQLAVYTARIAYETGHFHCAEVVRDTGRIHYCMWITDLHDQSGISLIDILNLSLTYCMELISDIVDRPVCRLR